VKIEAVLRSGSKLEVGQSSVILCRHNEGTSPHRKSSHVKGGMVSLHDELNLKSARCDISRGKKMDSLPKVARGHTLYEGGCSCNRLRAPRPYAVWVEPTRLAVPGQTLI
jgi:hypothetical protein